MTNPLVSVLILTYNQEDTIARAIESVLAQQADVSYEIIIGDDASTDNTRRVCQEYVSRYPEIIRLMPAAPNKGLVDNYFDCLDAARGKYIADCAGDDHWCDDFKLCKMTCMLEENPDASVVYSDAILRWPDGREQFTSETGLHPYCDSTTERVEGNDMLVAVLNSSRALPYILSTALYRKEPVKEILRRSPEIVRNRRFGIEDLPVMAALASQGAALHYAVPTLIYEQQDESVSNSASPVKLVNFYSRSLECTRRLAEYYNISQERLKDSFDSKARYIAGLAFNSGDTTAISLVRETLSCWSLSIPFTARLNIAFFSIAPLRRLLATVKRLLRR